MTEFKSYELFIKTTFPKSNAVIKFKSLMSSMVISKARCKSSHQRCSVEKGVLRNFTKFTVKHLSQSLFFNKGLQLY